MKTVHWIGVSMMLGALALSGCGQQTSKEPNKDQSGEQMQDGSEEEDKADAKIEAALAKLSSEDRKLAEAQKTCPISGEPLGSMGEPVKIMVKDEPVFLCCNVCKKDAEADPDKTLGKVKELKAGGQK